jgi:CubicO group peptidase (beta-lactamase class C family)
MPHPIAAMAADPQAAADRLAESPFVNGVAVAGIVDGEISVGAAGVEPDFVFRPGSITKLLTATLVVQCAVEGLLDLDDPLARYVPELTLDGPHEVRVRHLISHSSGIDAGDVFVDTGDDDPVARYVELLQGTGFLFEPGRTFSYNNAGFVLAGRVLEVVRGMPWTDVVRTQLFEPLGMSSSGFSRLDAEYTVDVGGEQRSLGQITFPSLGPAGGTLTATAGDMARFLRWHLEQPWTAPMRELAAPAPGGVALMHGAGMGWMVWEGSTRIGGANPGMSGQLAFEPATGAALVTLTNTDAGVNAVSAVLDADAPPAPDQGAARTTFDDLVGTYRSHAMEVEARAADGGLELVLPGFPSAVVTPTNATTFSSMLGPIALFDGLLRWRMRCLRRV